jgi:CRP-like cAMP-binding protein
MDEAEFPIEARAMLRATVNKLGIRDFDKIDWPYPDQINFVRLEKGQIYQPADDTQYCFALVGSGLVAMLFDSQPQRVRSFAGEGQFINLDVATEDTNAKERATISAIEMTTLTLFSTQLLSNLAAQCTEWSQLIINLLLQDLKYHQLRSSTLQTLSAPERFARFSENFPDLLARIPQYLIADYLNMKPETLSRIRRQRLLDRRNSSEDQGLENR